MPTRYERELNEILAKSGDLKPRRSYLARMRELLESGLLQLGRVTPFFPRFSTRLLVPLGFLLLLVALVLKSPVLAIIAIALLALSYLLYLGRPRTSNRKSWRGQDISDR